MEELAADDSRKGCDNPQSLKERSQFTFPGKWRKSTHPGQARQMSSCEYSKVSQG